MTEATAGKGPVEKKAPKQRAPLCWLILSTLLAGFCLWRSVDTANIEDVEPGDLMIAADPEGGTIRPRRVEQSFQRQVDHLQILTVRSSDGTVQTIETTDEHPFRVPGRGWVEAGRLNSGDKVQQLDGDNAVVVANVYEPHPDGVPVYNFEVEDFHSYFVTANGSRAPPLLVHNADCQPRDELGRFTTGAGGYTADAARGMEAHRNYRNALGSNYDYRARLPSGGRPDAVDFENRIVRELKPNNPRAIQDGRRQLERYRQELEEVFGGDWTSYLDTYNP